MRREHSTNSMERCSIGKGVETCNAHENTWKVREREREGGGEGDESTGKAVWLLNTKLRSKL